MRYLDAGAGRKRAPGAERQDDGFKPAKTDRRRRMAYRRARNTSPGSQAMGGRFNRARGEAMRQVAAELADASPYRAGTTTALAVAAGAESCAQSHSQPMLLPQQSSAVGAVSIAIVPS